MSRTVSPPFIVLQPAEGVLPAVVDELREAGWRIHEGWDFAPQSWGIEAARVVCVGVVRGQNDAEAAVLAAARGTGIAAVAECRKDVAERLFQDLRRLGDVRLRGPAEPDPRSPLDREQRRLLELLAEGGTLDEAAMELGYSRRTINRRLREIRQTLGVETTAEALARFTIGSG